MGYGQYRKLTAYMQCNWAHMCDMNTGASIGPGKQGHSSQVQASRHARAQR
jgi:hypothetical protein